MTEKLSWTLMASHIPAGGGLGGIVRYSVELARALAMRDDVALTVVARRSAAGALAEMVDRPVHIKTVRDVPTLLLSFGERHSSVTAPGSPRQVIQGVKHLVPARTNALRVLTVHDMFLLDRAADFGRVKRNLLPGPYRRSIRSADVLLCVSEATRSRLIEHEPSAEPRVAVTPLATSPALLGSTPTSVAGLLGTQFVLVVGDRSARKNLRTLFTAWARVRTTHPKAVLVTVGPPDWSDVPIGSLFDMLTKAGAVRALGYVADAQLRWLYENACVVVCPSLAEGFGLPAAEALDLGASVIISDDPALREVAARRHSAVVSPYDVAGWERAILASLAGQGESSAHPAVPRTWAEVAEDTVTAVRRGMDRRRACVADETSAGWRDGGRKT